MTPEKNKVKTPALDKDNWALSKSNSETPVEITEADLEIVAEVCELFTEVIDKAERMDDFESEIKRRNQFHIDRKSKKLLQTVQSV